jgi:hypothetical protein
MAVDLLAGIGAFKSMYDAAKALKDMNDAAVRNGAVIELQSQILAAQEQQATLTQRKGELEAELDALKSWEAEKLRYEMISLAPNVVAYAEKASLADRGPPHFLCANCYARREKSFLQQAVRGEFVDRFKCNTCGEELTINKGERPRQVTRHSSNFGPNGWMGLEWTPKVRHG